MTLVYSALLRINNKEVSNNYCICRNGVVEIKQGFELEENTF